MIVRKEIRRIMLQDLVDALTFSGVTNSASKTIKFYSASGDMLCSVGFYDIDDFTTNDRVFFKFRSLDQSSYQLRNAASMPGTVSYFEIDGIVDPTPGGQAIISDLIRGSVGGLGTSTDIQFNRLQWASNTTITLTDLSLVMLQGS